MRRSFSFAQSSDEENQQQNHQSNEEKNQPSNQQSNEEENQRQLKKIFTDFVHHYLTPAPSQYSLIFDPHPPTV